MGCHAKDLRLSPDRRAIMGQPSLAARPMAAIARLRLFVGETEVIGHAHEVDQRLRSHLSHDLTPEPLTV
jgi:hypothetical protein